MCDDEAFTAGRLASLNTGISEIVALPLGATPVDSERDVFTVSWSVVEASNILTMLRDPRAAPMAIEVCRLSEPVDGYVELAVITTRDIADYALGMWRAAGGHEPLGSCLHTAISNTAYPEFAESPDPTDISSADLADPAEPREEHGPGA